MNDCVSLLTHYIPVQQAEPLRAFMSGVTNWSGGFCATCWDRCLLRAMQCLLSIADLVLARILVHVLIHLQYRPICRCKFVRQFGQRGRDLDVNKAGIVGNVNDVDYSRKKKQKNLSIYLK